MRTLCGTRVEDATPKYDVIVTETKDHSMTVSARDEAEAKQLAVDLVSNPGRLAAAVTIPTEHPARYSAAAKPSR
jgi:hypothetical protein